MALFDTLSTKFGDRIALINEEGASLRYADLEHFSVLLNEKVTKRTLVFSLCTNTFGSLLGYYSFISNGIVPIMLEASLDGELLKNLLDIYSPKYLWMPDDKLIGFKKYKVVYSGFGYHLVQYTDCQHRLNPDLALLLTTSGSTGSPKLVRLSYQNIKANAESIAEYLQITENERPVTTLPMNYSYGLSVINSHLIKGATVLLTNSSITQKEFWTFVKEQKATSMAGVPYTYEILNRLHFFRMNLPDIKTLTQAGGKLSPDLVKEFANFALESGRKFYVMYGQTEATARMSYLPFEKASEKYGSMGIAIPGGHFSLIDENENEILTANIDGELVYSGKNVSLGYAECSDDLAKGDVNKGVLHTGDIAYRDQEGYYFITGRLKRFIKIYGNRVNLDATEQIVKPITSACACVGKDDKMIVYVTDASLCTKVKKVLSEKTGIHTRAFEVRFINEIPKNDSGKVQYAKLDNE